MERLVRQLILQPLALGDVTEAPDSSDRHTGDLLWHGVPLEGSAAGELDQVLTAGIRLRVQLSNLGQESVRIDDLADDPGESSVVVAAGQNILGQAPHLDESAVEAGYLAIEANDENAVGRGVEGGAEERERLAKFGLGVLALGDLLNRSRDSDGCAVGVDGPLGPHVEPSCVAVREDYAEVV